jgi:hypothetical protein
MDKLETRNVCRRVPQVFQEPRSHLKILGAARLMWRMIHHDDPQILGATVQQFSRNGDLACGICAPLVYGMLYRRFEV